MNIIRTFLWITLVLVAAPVAYSQGPPDRDAPRHLRLSVVAQEADSTQYELLWLAPPGQQGQRVTGYDCQVDIDDDPVGFEGSGFIPEFECSTDSGTRSVRFWVPSACDQPQTWVHTRVRVRGNFSDTSIGPWVLGEPHTFTPPPCVVNAPTTLEIFLDSLGSGVADPPPPDDTTEVQLQMSSAAWFPNEQRIDWDPWTADLDDTLIQCFYTWAPHPESADSVRLYGKWPAECPDEGIVSSGPIPSIPDSLVEVRCRGEVQASLPLNDGVPWTQWQPADNFDLNCGGVLNWTSSSGD